MELTHPDRLLWPDAGVTKAALARYWTRVAARALPHLAGRPLALVRCPDGQGGDCFFQKHPTRALPAAVRRIEVPERRAGRAAAVAVDDLEGLLGLVQASCLEIHVWGCRADDVERPDTLVLDLDPGEGVTWTAVVATARELRARLGAHGLEAFAKVTGSRGVHVVAPLRPAAGWDRARALSRDLARALAADAPAAHVASARDDRRGRIFVDWLRNARGATSVAPWSPRARPAASVACPVRWDELASAGNAARWDLAAATRRAAMLRADPWEGYEDARRPLPP